MINLFELFESFTLYITSNIDTISANYLSEALAMLENYGSINAFPYVVNDQDLTRLVRYRLKYNEQKQCTNAFMVMTDPQVLQLAYETIKSK